MAYTLYESRLQRLILPAYKLLSTIAHRIPTYVPDDCLQPLRVKELHTSTALQQPFFSETFTSNGTEYQGQLRSGDPGNVRM